MIRNKGTIHDPGMPLHGLIPVSKSLVIRLILSTISAHALTGNARLHLLVRLSLLKNKTAPLRCDGWLTESTEDLLLAVLLVFFCGLDPVKSARSSVHYVAVDDHGIISAMIAVRPTRNVRCF